MIDDYLDGSLDPGAHRLTAADGMITYAADGDALSADARANLDRAIEQLASGDDPTAPHPDRCAHRAGSRCSSPERAPGPSRDVPVRFTLPPGWDDIGWGVIKADPTSSGWSSSTWPTSTPTPANRSRSTRRSVRPSTTSSRRWPTCPPSNATAATDVTVDGFDGKQVEFTVPDYDRRVPGRLRLRRPLHGAGGRRHPDDGYWAQGPNQHHRLWILDVDGTRLVIGAIVVPGHLGTGPGRHRRDPQLHPDRLTAGPPSSPRVETDRKIVGTLARRARRRLRRVSERHRSRCGDPVRQPVSPRSRGGLLMSVEPTPSVRPRRAGHGSPSGPWPSPSSPPSRSPPVPQTTPTSPRGRHPGADRIDHAAAHRRHPASRSNVDERSPHRAPASFGDVPVTFTRPGRLGATWAGPWSREDPIFGLLFMEVANIFTDPCQSVAARPARRSDRRRPRLGVGRPARLRTPPPRPTSPSTGSTASRSSSRSPTTTGESWTSAPTAAISCCWRASTLPATATGPKARTNITNCGSSTSTAPGW